MDKKIKRILCGGMAALLLCAAAVQSAAAADTSQIIDETKEKAKELEKKKKASEDEIDTLAEGLDKIIREMDETSEKLTEKQEEIEKAEEELVEAKVQENVQYQNMKKRIRFMYENGGIHILEVLFSSKDIGDFLNKAEYASHISAYDRKMLTEFQDTVEEIAEKEERLKEEYSDLEELREDLSKRQEEAEQLLEEKEMKLSDVEEEIGENAKLLKALMKQAEEERKREEQAKKAKKGDAFREADSGLVVSGDGRFTNPCPGASVSSTFGYRSFDSAFHKGLDLAAPTGTPTYAADDGVVLYACWSDSAGNWVVIDHGDGFVTKYMHHSALAVRAGEHVKKGQQIGYVGNTGDSYGSHLHFQVEYEGTPVDPQKFL